ncbi:TatD family deoxyribonuclease [Patescibacteria group bacterium]|nr:MAG: TatD family deoxyribonuclease [Patescibacteria group bacterium]
MFDTHAHLNFPEFDSDLKRVIERAKSAKITGIINPGSSLKHSRTACELAQKHPFIYPAVGLHPHEAAGLNPKDLDLIINKLTELVEKNKVVAIGETGLDYYRVGGGLDRKALSEEKIADEIERIQGIQKKLFKAQLNLAQEKNLPMIIHCRDAYEELLKIVKDYKLKGVVHCFSGNAKQAKEFLSLGLHLSFTGVITFVKDDDELIKIIGETPLEKILLETDAPYLTPEPYRGKRNEPAYVKFIAEKIANIKGISVEEVIKTTNQNTKNLFNLT